MQPKRSGLYLPEASSNYLLGQMIREVISYMSATKCPFFLTWRRKTSNLTIRKVRSVWDVMKERLPPCTPGSGSAQTWRTHWRIHPHPAAASSWPSWVPGKGLKLKYISNIQNINQTNRSWLTLRKKYKDCQGGFMCCQKQKDTRDFLTEGFSY